MTHFFRKSVNWLGTGVTFITFSALVVEVPPGSAADPPVQSSPRQSPPRQTTKPGKTKPQQPPDKFPPNPLELTTPDPLLPGGLKRPLTGAERQQLSRALDELNVQATEKLRAGDVVGAFATWNRELRLTRALGFLPEVQALGRVGDQAWKQNQQFELRAITKRLQAVQARVQSSQRDQVGLSERSKILSALGIAYQQVRLPELALSVYEPLLGEARQQKNAIEEFNLLNTIAQLHLTWFDYPKALATYGELLNLAKARKDQRNVIAYLTQLAYVHEQTKQPTEAAAYQQQLVDFYQRTQQAEVIPALKIKLANNYAASGRLDLAEQNYQEAFTAAQPLVQLAYASDALRKLGGLYRSNNRLDAALRVYEYLAAVQQQAYDVYGVMEAYDQIGQIQIARKAYPEALAAFRQGLEVSKQLNYRTEYFTEQVQKVVRQASS